MLLRATLVAATLLTAAPAFATSPAVNEAHVTRAVEDAITRCTMRQVRVPAGRGMGGAEVNCAQVAKTEVAALHRQQALAMRDDATTARRD